MICRLLILVVVVAVVVVDEEGMCHPGHSHKTTRAHLAVVVDAVVVVVVVVAVVHTTPANTLIKTPLAKEIHNFYRIIKTNRFARLSLHLFQFTFHRLLHKCTNDIARKCNSHRLYQPFMQKNPAAQPVV